MSILSRLSFASAGAVLLLTGCPGPAKNGGGPDGPGGGKEPPGAQDFDIDYEAAALPGTYFQPEGIVDRPPFLKAGAVKKLTLVKQRQAYQKAKPAHKVGEATVLATMLYTEAGNQKDESAALALKEEARKVLADTRAAQPTAVEFVQLHNLGCLSYDLGDPLAAGEAFGAAAAILDAHPDQATLLAPPKAKPDEVKKVAMENASVDRTYQIYFLVRAGKNGDAAAAANGITASSAEPELAYAIAWAAWRNGDNDRAIAAMQAATEGWRQDDVRPALRRDVAIFAARVAGNVDQGVALGEAFAKGDQKAWFDIMGLIHQALSLVGRYDDAVAVTDKMLASGYSPSKATTYALHFEKADAAKALGRPDDLVAAVKEGLASWAACGKECEGGGTETAVKLVFNYARFSNYLYTTSQDERWYNAANELYNAYLGLSVITDRDAVKQEAETLVRGHDRALKGVGTHDKDAVSFVLIPYRAQILACYDNELQANPELGGAVSLKLEVAQDGTVAGVASDPPGGEDGMAAVASCATAAARTWAFPARTRPGVTRIGVSYTFAKSQ